MSRKRVIVGCRPDPHDETGLRETRIEAERALRMSRTVGRCPFCWAKVGATWLMRHLSHGYCWDRFVAEKGMG